MDINAFNKLSYGVYIVSAGDKEHLAAFVATAVFQVTDSPNQIVVACNKKNYTTEFIRNFKSFAISVIKRNYSPEVMGNFGFHSGVSYNKFENYTPIFGENTGCPIILDDAIAWFECKLTSEVDVGSHIMFIGETINSKVLSNNDIPLTYSYYHEVKKGKLPANAPHAKIVENSNNNKNSNSMKYVCKVCGYVYDPEIGDPDSGIEPGTSFEDIPDDWTCPLCGVSKSDFEPEV